MPTLARIAIVDDHAMVRAGFAQLLDQWPGGKVVLSATDGVHYEELCATMAPIDIAVVDLRMPRRDGYETIARIVREQPATVPVALTYDPTDQVARKALRAGACTVWPKDIELEEMVRSLEKLRTARFDVNDVVRRQLDSTGRLLPDPDEVPARIADLFCPREREFIRVMCGPKNPSVPRAAKLMGISKHTARGYCKTVYAKLEVEGRLQFYKTAEQWNLHK